MQQEVDFRTTYVIWTAWEKGFDLGIPVAFKGWANYIGAKGKDGFGAETEAETVGDTYLMFDISQVFGRKKGAIFIGPGFEYWNNKFGDRNVTASRGNRGPWQTTTSRSTRPCSAREFHF